MTKFYIINETDGVPSGPMNGTDTKEQALEWILQTRKMFKDVQGYYSSVKYGRIDPDTVHYSVHEIEEEKESDNDEHNNEEDELKASDIL